MMTDETRQRRGCVSSVLMILVAVFVCYLVTAAFIDQTCVSNAAMWIPLYPKAQVLSEQHTLLRAFGTGVTTMTLYSADTPNVVRNWYYDMRKKLYAEKAAKGLATTDWSVEPADNGGSIIVLYSECASR